MKEGYIVDFAMSGNTIPGQCNEIVKAKGFLIDEYGNKKASCFDIDISLKNEFPLSIGLETYFGISGQYLATNSINRRDGLLKLVQIFQNIDNENIYLIGWNVSERILDSLESNLKQSGISIDIRSVFSKIEILDIQECSNYCVEPNDLFGANITLENICYFLNKKSISNVDFQNKVITNRMNPDKCLLTTTSMMLNCLKNEMRMLDSNALDSMKNAISSPKSLKTMSFGKYKGRSLLDIYSSDKQYVYWLLSQESIVKKCPNLKYSFDQIISSDIE